VSIHGHLRVLVAQHGEGVLQSSEELRALLDDYLHETEISVGELNLLVDAVRMHALHRLVDLVAQGADPRTAVEAAGGELARDRSGDPRAAMWAVAALGHAVGRVPESVVLAHQSARGGAGPQPPPVTTDPRPTTGPTHAPPADDQGPPPHHPGQPPHHPGPPFQQAAPPPSALQRQAVPPPGFSKVPASGPAGVAGRVLEESGSRRAWIAAALAAIVVLAVVAVVVVVLLQSGDRPSSSADSDGDRVPSSGGAPPEEPEDSEEPEEPEEPEESEEPTQPITRTALARDFAALGSTVADGMNQCLEGAPVAGAQARVSCRYAFLDVVYTSWTHTSALQRERDRLTAQADGGGLVEKSTSENATYLLVSDQTRKVTWLYWDSAVAMQSGYLETPFSRLSAQGARDWFDQRGETDASRVFPLSVPSPFSSPALWEFASAYIDDDEAARCERNDDPITPAGHEPFDIEERLECPSPGGYTFFFILLGDKTTMADSRERALEDTRGSQDPDTLSGTWSRNRGDVYGYPVTGRWIDSYKPFEDFAQIYFDVEAHNMYGFLRGPLSVDSAGVHERWETLTARAANAG
jgi:hypothetical protein